jgi:hypothetical protein
MNKEIDRYVNTRYIDIEQIYVEQINKKHESTAQPTRASSQDSLHRNRRPSRSSRIACTLQPPALPQHSNSRMRAHLQRVLHAVLPLPPARPDLEVAPAQDQLELRQRGLLRRRMDVRRVRIVARRRRAMRTRELRRGCDGFGGEVGEEAAVFVVCTYKDGVT